MIYICIIRYWNQRDTNNHEYQCETCQQDSQRYFIRCFLPGTNISIAAILSLFVCLIPTTIGGLLSAIGIAGMDRALRANVITKSGKAVETAG